MSIEQRLFLRRPVGVLAMLSDSDGNGCSGHSTNLALGGLLMVPRAGTRACWDRPDSRQTSLYTSLHLPLDGSFAWFETLSTVVWSGTAGVALHFDATPVRTLCAIASCLAAQPAPSGAETIRCWP